MPRSSAEYWEEKFIGGKEQDDRFSFGKEKEEKFIFGKDREEEECEIKHEPDCDRESAKALRRIASLLSELNNSDLRLLDEIIHRALCARIR